ncbi:MAG: hypothetical protein CUN56_02955 [Phototrophicales bacterium]|nr:MAG: hypothetical protein CUN56_02955 [Phototrophicales bacterium]RMG76319.1 MAG: polymer-forming cytoskeletal protein [Chloroflexota bacterium]
MSFFSSRRKPDEDQDPTESAPSIKTPPPPPSPKPRPVTIGFETVLGASTILEGKLTSGGNVRLDGTFTGTLNISGNVLVGETAKITADIDAHNISIAGSVRGNVSGNKIQLLRTGRVWGDIHAVALATEEGAFIDGKITMKNAPKPFDQLIEQIDEDISTDEPNGDEDNIDINKTLNLKEDQTMPSNEDLTVSTQPEEDDD